jgi:nitroreductase
MVSTIIRSRHSVRKFREKEIEELIIHDAVECARLAPTAMNRQPWLIGVIHDKAIRKEIAALTDNGKFIEQAPVCFAIFGERDAVYYLEDCCAATQTLILALQGYGVGTCWVAGDKKGYAEEVRRCLQVPERYRLVSLVAAGYPADIPIAPKKGAGECTFRDRYTPPV